VRPTPRLADMRSGRCGLRKPEQAENFLQQHRQKSMHREVLMGKTNGVAILSL